MPAEYTQEHRSIRIATPLGEDVLLLEKFSGEEGVSQLFRFDLHLLSTNRSIPFDSVVGKEATVQIVRHDGAVRYFNGVVSSFVQGGESRRLARYRAELVPWLWLLTRTSDCRIFQNLTAPDIIQKVFQDFGFSDFRNKLHGSFRQRDYCVQYRETAFNFVSRLMEEEGIFYFFEHEADKHTLVLANNPGEFKECPSQASARYDTDEGAGRADEVVTSWSIGQEVRPGKYTVADFDFEKPLLDLTATVEGADQRHYEIYDYPGAYKTKEEGEQLVGVRMQEEESLRVSATGEGTCRMFIPGYRFDLEDHYRRDLNRAYVLTSVSHRADEGADFESGGETQLDYGNFFHCLPHPTAFRPSRSTPRPVVHGTQTAIVVGPAGEDIFVDKYGRVKVQFHWDRDGKYNEKSSCWVRVSENWAGKRWGAVFLPRVGQEVIVNFEEGDPDRPIVTGRVYNGSAMPPYALPDEKTKSAIKSYSSKGGGGFNEIRFEDKKGDEQLFIHAQKDDVIRVEKDLKEWVGQDSHLIVKRDQLEKVEGDKHLSVTGDRNEQVDGAVSLKTGQDLQQKVGTKAALDAGMEVHIKAGMNVVVEAGMSITLKAGGGFVVIGPAGVTISGTPVLINSGGAAGAGSGCSPAPPTEPAEAAESEAGEAAELPPPRAPRAVVTYSPAALVMRQAAQSGMPFCDI